MQRTSILNLSNYVQIMNNLFTIQYQGIILTKLSFTLFELTPNPIRQDRSFTSNCIHHCSNREHFISFCSSFFSSPNTIKDISSLLGLTHRELYPSFLRWEIHLTFTDNLIPSYVRRNFCSIGISHLLLDVWPIGIVLRNFLN